ncbi:alpha-ketoglutarate-dependent dioxygenase AlkB, partial [Streptomyces sp. G35A]
MRTHHLPALQGSLFDQADELRLGPLDGVRRTEPDQDARIDLLPGRLAGSDTLLDHLAAQVPWRAERRRMYDRVVDVPRLLPHPVPTEARDALSAYYGDELGEPFATAGPCCYRDGR